MTRGQGPESSERPLEAGSAAELREAHVEVRLDDQQASVSRPGELLQERAEIAVALTGRPVGRVFARAATAAHQIEVEDVALALLAFRRSARLGREVILES